jgi:molybdopterin-biosynthesis enzyme MoeA-like protein
MEYARERLEQLLADLVQQRDHLKVRLYFSETEARKEWLKLEPRFEQLRMKLEAALREMGRANASLDHFTELAIEEIRNGYERVRQLMKRAPTPRPTMLGKVRSPAR